LPPESLRPRSGRRPTRRFRAARPAVGTDRLAGLTTGLALILALFGQFLVHERANLAVHPELKVLGDALCRFLPCPASSGRAPASIRVGSLQISEPDAARLRFEIELHNTLDRSQPWPLLQLALSDRHGRVIGQARWHPSQYLAGVAGLGQEVPLLGAGERRRLALEVRPPPRQVDGVVVWPL
jgi:hypothetical protein